MSPATPSVPRSPFEAAIAAAPTPEAVREILRDWPANERPNRSGRAIAVATFAQRMDRALAELVLADSCALDILCSDRRDTITGDPDAVALVAGRLVAIVRGYTETDDLDIDWDEVDVTMVATWLRDLFVEARVPCGAAAPRTLAAVVLDPQTDQTTAFRALHALGGCPDWTEAALLEWVDIVHPAPQPLASLITHPNATLRVLQAVAREPLTVDLAAQLAHHAVARRDPAIRAALRRATRSLTAETFGPGLLVLQCLQGLAVDAEPAEFASLVEQVASVQAESALALLEQASAEQVAAVAPTALHGLLGHPEQDIRLRAFDLLQRFSPASECPEPIPAGQSVQPAPSRPAARRHR